MDSQNNPGYSQQGDGSQQDAPGASQQEPRRRSSRLPFLLLLLLGVIVLAFLPTLMGQIEYERTKGEVKALRESLPALNLRSLSKAFSLVYRKVKPSVVHINTRRELAQQRNMLGPFFNGRQGSYEEEGEASGFIVDPNGYVITNLHVVENASEVTIVLDDGRSFTAEALGVDPALDLAVLKIDATGLTPITWGDSDKLDVGEMVWAIGNPYGLDQTITSGIVSAKGRRDLGGSPLQEFLQTDVPINPGSSGGPLVDVNGDVVGVNSAIFGRTYQGISFAIPSNVAKEVYEKIRANGKVIRGYLGVDVETVTPALATHLKLPAGHTSGAVVLEVSEGSPADKAGLKLWDVIYEWNGQPVNEARELRVLIAGAQVGTKVPIKLMRDGKEMTMDVSVLERPAQLK